MNLEQRFAAKVKWNNDCLEWQNSLDNHGYGQIWVKEVGRPVKAHRVAWFLEFGDWPARSLLHSCDNPLCVNTQHLKEGTQAENLGDMAAKGRARNGNQLLTPEIISAVKAGLAESKQYRVIAQECNVSIGTVVNINRRP